MYPQAQTERSSGPVAFTGALENIWLTAFGSGNSVEAGILGTAINGGLDPNEQLS
jgi:hypothetical protein